MYAIVKTGGKQYRVEQGQSLLVERLPVTTAARPRCSRCCTWTARTSSTARTWRRSRSRPGSSATSAGPKLRVVKFKPKRGYKRRTGHRQELTRIEVT